MAEEGLSRHQQHRVKVDVWHVNLIGRPRRRAKRAVRQTGGGRRIVGVICASSDCCRSGTSSCPVIHHTTTDLVPLFSFSS